MEQLNNNFKNYKELKAEGTRYIECGRTMENKGFGVDLNLDKTTKKQFSKIYGRVFGNSAYAKSLIKKYKKVDYVNALLNQHTSETAKKEIGAVKLEYSEFESWRNSEGVYFENEEEMKDAYFRFVWNRDDVFATPALW